MAVPPQSAFHCVEIGEGDLTGIRTLQQLPLWENGGYFALRPEIFDHLPENGDLIADACAPLAAPGPDARLPAHAVSGTRPTRSRSAPRWRRSTAPATARGCCGSRHHHRDPLQSAIAGLGAAEHRI